MSSHAVEWHGVFRGTEEDPREVGFCETCGREVHDRDGTHTADTEPRAPGCQCQWEIGDSPCPVHGLDEGHHANSTEPHESCSRWEAKP